MKILKLVLPVLTALICAPGQAPAAPLPSGELKGDIVSGGVGTAGAKAAITGNFTPTLGANSNTCVMAGADATVLNVGTSCDGGCTSNPDVTASPDKSAWMSGRQK